MQTLQRSLEKVLLCMQKILHALLEFKEHQLVHARVGWIVETLKYPAMPYIYDNNGKVRDLLSLMEEEELQVQAGNYSRSTPLLPTPLHNTSSGTACLFGFFLPATPSPPTHKV